MTNPQDRFQDLAPSIGESSIRTDPETVAAYAVDGMRPGAVVFPKDTQAVAHIVAYANRKGLAVVPTGSGTKIDRGNPPRRFDLVVCLSRMDHMIDVDTANLTLTVEAGVKFRDIQARLATEDDRCYLPLEDLETEAGEVVCSEREHRGSFLPIDAPWGDRATVGGIIASNSSGPRRLLYNHPRDVIIGVRFVSPTGAIVGMGGKTVKNVSGYDISKLMVGSMGTLGILCETTLRLLPLPERMETLLAAFDRLSDAAAFSDGILAGRLLPAAVEVMNRRAAAGFGSNQWPGAGDAPYVVAVALEAFDQAVARMKRDAASLADECGARDQTVLDEHRHGGFWLQAGNLTPAAARKYPGLVAAKLTYEMSRWKEIAALAETTLSAAGIAHTYMAHSGIGIGKINLLLAENGGQTASTAIDALNTLLDGCRRAGGNLVVQRAPARLKPKLNIWGAAGGDAAVTRRLKDHLDPNGIMCPGRFVGGL